MVEVSASCFQHAATWMQGSCVGGLPFWPTLLDDGNRSVALSDGNFLIHSFANAYTQLYDHQ